MKHRLETIIYGNNLTKKSKRLVLAYLNNKWGRPNIITRMINNVVIILNKE